MALMLRGMFFLSAALFPSKERRTYPLNLDFAAKKLTPLA